MKYLYTTEPDNKCHEVEPGIYGRPVHTAEQRKLIQKGWRKFPHALRKEERQQETRRQQKGPDVDELRELYEYKFGEQPHHRMKAETIVRKLEEADD